MLNSIIIMGRLVADPVVRQTQNNISVASFRIACDRENVQQNAEQKADFIDCVAWRKTAEFVNRYFTKGKPILIQGRLQIRPWTDKDGNKRTSTEILVNSIDFCGGDKFDRNGGQQNPVAGPTQAVPPEFSELGGDDDLPWEDHDLA